MCDIRIACIQAAGAKEAWQARQDWGHADMAQEAILAFIVYKGTSQSELVPRLLHDSKQILDKMSGLHKYMKHGI